MPLPGVDGDDDGAENAGSAYIYELDESVLANPSLSQIQKFTPPNPTLNDHLGMSAEVDGNTAVVGSPGRDLIEVAYNVGESVCVCTKWRCLEFTEGINGG